MLVQNTTAFPSPAHERAKLSASEPRLLFHESALTPASERYLLTCFIRSRDCSMRSSLPPEALSVSLCSLVGLGVALGLGVDVGLGVAAMLDEDGCFVVERRAVGSFVSTYRG